MPGAEIPFRRSAHSSTGRRVRSPWASDRNFRILSLDGGGIKGIFTAAFLAELEGRTGKKICDQFDLITGTSTGGILAIGLAAGLPASDLLALYVNRGGEIFPPRPWLMWLPVFLYNLAFTRYSVRPLRTALTDVLGNAQLKDISVTRLCIQTFDAFHGEVFVYKTPHHQDYYLDGDTSLVDVAIATSAAPSFFKLHLNRSGYLLGDGGVWANNPTMIGVVEALSAFQTQREQIRVLSIGCGSAYKTAGVLKVALGGMLPWCKAVYTAMHLQSENAIGQARLLLGPRNVVRIDVEDKDAAKIKMDDWKSARHLLPKIGAAACAKHFESIKIAL